MDTKKIPYLCGGILFTLIVQARTPRRKARNKLNGGSDRLNDTDVMDGLIYAVTGCHAPLDSGDSFKIVTNKFKTCQDYGPTYIPFKNKSTLDTFNSAYENKNPYLIDRMSGFVGRYLTDTKTEWLVKALIEVIREDEDIPLNTIFWIDKDTALRKKDFDSISHVSLPVFLLSVMHFILNERKDNTLGRATFEAWHSHGEDKSPWRFISNVGLSIQRRIIINGGFTVEEREEVKPLNTKETSDNDSLFIPFVSKSSDLDKSHYSPEDKELLKEFTDDYDDVMILLMGDNYGDSLIDMSLPEKIKNLYEAKWRSKADGFSDPLLKSLVYGLIGELNKLSDSFICGCSHPGSLGTIRRKVRNLYVKLHPESYSVSMPYDAFIDDWDDGELY